MRPRKLEVHSPPNPPLSERHVVAATAFVELRVWRVPASVRGSAHSYKYALAYVVNGECVPRYDNEAGKGDHLHRNGEEHPYFFVTPARLLADFWRDVDQWRPL